ncbi:uncharacterized protein [Phaseolus vulgaris]|uniref:uncharacterized protein isoform X2 n=1 Tax=Phaseolus vulgaris TaxID=3885 RepID=UPI0035CBA9A2
MLKLHLRPTIFHNFLRMISPCSESTLHLVLRLRGGIIKPSLILARSVTKIRLFVAMHDPVIFLTPGSSTHEIVPVYKGYVIEVNGMTNNFLRNISTLLLQLVVHYSHFRGKENTVVAPRSSTSTHVPLLGSGWTSR